MIEFKVNADLCTRCGECVLDCISQIVEMEDGAPFVKPENEKECMECQHCFTVCPTGAVSIFGMNTGNSAPLTSEFMPSLEQMSTLVRGRRTVRRYKDENVDPALVKRILADTANAPTGGNARKLTFNVIDDKEAMKSLRMLVLDEIGKAADEGTLPEGATYLKRAITLWHNENRDLLFRTAPHAIIVTAPPDAPCPQEDVVIALAYFELLAQSAGLGTVWWGMMRWVLETLPHLKDVLGIPRDHRYYAMLFGMPSYQYARTAQKDAAAKVRRIKI